MDYSIETIDIHKDFGSKVKALDGITLTIPTGKIFGLLGPNGAGKTTLIRVLSTLLLPTSGIAKIGELDLVSDAAKIREIIGLTGQYTALDENMTGFENLYMVGKLYHLSNKDAKERAAGLLDKFDLTDASKRLAKTYSGGMKRRLDLAASLVGDPKVLFLDEPTTGLDIHSRITLWGIIKNLSKSGTTILLTTQYLEEADNLSDNIAVIDKGRIIAQGTPRQLKTQVGGDVVEIHVREKNQAPSAAAAISQYGINSFRIDQETGKITLPVEGGASVLVDIVRTLDNKQIFIEDIVLRRPTLDEVFIKLTGYEAKERGEEVSEIEKTEKGEIFIYEND